MSDMAQSALPGARYEGFVTVAEAGLRGMITLRGDLSSLAGGRKRRHGAARCLHNGGSNGRAKRRWHGMSPDEVLILCDYADGSRIGLVAW